jgi:glycosyltransferase involved in cell wall biosynthesis
MRFSIIIPTFNESRNISSCIRSILNNSLPEDKGSNVEIIITDGGSKDNTLEMASKFNNRIKLRTIKSEEACLPDQLNKGARIAEGDILIFLHADCRLSNDALYKIEQNCDKSPGLAGGAFTMRVEGNRFFYNILSAGGNIYSWTTKTFFGDRAIFVRKEIFDGISGFKNLSIMSDYDFSKRLKKAGRVRLLKGPVISNGRKFEDEPFYKIIYLAFWSLIGFDLGIDPAIIRKKYYGSGTNL